MCQAFPDVTDLGEIEAKKKKREGWEHWPLKETTVRKSGSQVGLSFRFLSDASSRGIEKFLLLCATSPSKSCFYEPFGSNAHVFTRPATGSAWKKRVQKYSSATHREVKGNPKPPSPELLSLALSEHRGLVRLQLWSWMDEGPCFLLCTGGLGLFLASSCAQWVL